jgi:NitT/TauT family transport system substrate-binding protein
MEVGCSKIRVLLCVALALVTGTATRPADAADKIPATVLLAVGIQTSALRDMVAKSLGFDDEEGIDVQLVPALGSATEVQYMAAGRGMLGSIDVDMAIRQRKDPAGLKLRAVYSNLQSGVYSMAMLDQTPIKTIADLKGKTVGVPTQASGSYQFMMTLAKLAGLKDGDFTVVAVGFGPTAADALTRGRIDMLSTIFTDVLNLKYLSEHGGQFKLRELTVPQNAYPTNAAMVTESDAVNKRPMIIGVLRAFAKAQLFVATNPAAGLKVAKKLYPELVRDDDMERQITLMQWSNDISFNAPRYRDKPLGYFDMEAWKGTEQYYRDGGLIGPDDHVADVIDTSFLDEINNFDKERVRQMARDYK